MSPVIWVVLAAVVLLLAAGAYFALRHRPAPTDGQAYHFECPGCGRRLRYHARQAGHTGQCPRCRKHLTFPRHPS